MLSKELKRLCGLASAGHAGHFDGPRAYQILVHFIDAGPRSKEADKTFYRTAEYIQRTKVLPNGCAAADYGKKALAFLTHIQPNVCSNVLV